LSSSLEHTIGKLSISTKLVVTMKRTGLSFALLFGCAAILSALEYDLCPFIQAGSGQAYGSLLSSKGDFYSEIGSSSYTDKGSSSPYFPILLGGLGADLALSKGPNFLMKKNRSLVLGIELGAWGGAVKGESAEGDEFASTRARSLVFAIRADERFRFPLGERNFMSLAFGPIVGFNCRYFMQEDINGIYGKTSLKPRLVDVLFLGFGLGYDYGFRLGRGDLIFGLRGDMGLTHLSSKEGALGDVISLPWRVLGRVGYEFPIGGSRKGSMQ
jgi:hypothetical protein